MYFVSQTDYSRLLCQTIAPLQGKGAMVRQYDVGCAFSVRKTETGDFLVKSLYPVFYARASETPSDNKTWFTPRCLCLVN